MENTLRGKEIGIADIDIRVPLSSDKHTTFETMTLAIAMDEWKCFWG